MRRSILTLCAALLCFPSTAFAGESLKDVKIPFPKNLGNYVANRGAAIALGKALFWDEQVGGDGIQACATCHFHAGSDSRTFNTVNPGSAGQFDIVGGPDEEIFFSAFPISNDDVVGSNGVVTTTFDGLSGNAVDLGTPADNDIFGTSRQVTGRNSPPVINAIFDELQFHDGRASDVFNGVDPSGAANQTAHVWKVNRKGKLRKVRVRLQPASLASQAVGPPNSDVEMAWSGRSFPELGRKMLGLQPLGQQEIALDDSVFEGYVANLPEGGSGNGMGLTLGYDDLIKAAFKKKFWASKDRVDGEFTQMEANFSLFWGISILMYEATLVSDETPYDNGTLTAHQLFGEEVFNDHCETCHRAPEFTEAAITNGGSDDFVNIGVRPWQEDNGRGGAEFKTPGLRNVELTGPFMHNGGFATLRQVVDFYDRGGDFPNDEIEPMGMTNQEKRALVDFMMALTDERVRTSAAPFDHPQLRIPNGPTLPAVGKNGGGPLLEPFLGLDQFAP